MAVGELQRVHGAGDLDATEDFRLALDDLVVERAGECEFGTVSADDEEEEGQELHEGGGVSCGSGVTVRDRWTMPAPGLLITAH